MASAGVFTLSSWFKLPQFGMRSFELLARASAFVLPNQRGGNHKRNATIMGAAHVTHPFLFPSYYPLTKYPWIGQIKEDDTRYLLEERDISGAITNIFVIESTNVRHPINDLIALQFTEEEDAKFAKKSETNHGYFSELSEDFPLQGHNVWFMGYEITDAGLPSEKCKFHPVDGKVEFVTKQRMFGSTATVLPMGLCGGPVISRENSKCVGILEGYIPREANFKIQFDENLGANEIEDHQKLLEQLKGLAVFLGSPSIKQFLEESSKQLAETTRKVKPGWGDWIDERT